MRFDTKHWNCGIKYSRKIRSLNYIYRSTLFTKLETKGLFYFQQNSYDACRITLSRVGCVGSPSQYFRVVSTKSSCVKQS